MALEDDGWWNEMMKYIRSVENSTVNALKRIKRDPIRNNLPFDEAFQKYFLQKINARIADAYTDFLLGGNFEGGGIMSNQPVYERIGNGNANILEMPVILEQLNNQNASTLYSQNGNEMLEQVVISIPSNPLLIPSQMNSNENSGQESRGSGENKLLIVSNPNKNIDTVQQNAVGGGESAVASTSTSVDNMIFSEPLKRMVDSNIHQPDTIDLTTDQAEANDGIVGGHVQLQLKCQKDLREKDGRMTNQTIISKTQNDPSNSPREIEKELHGGAPSSTETVETNVSQDLEDITPNKANEETTVGEEFELTIKSGAANTPNDDDSQQKRAALNSHETLSHSTGARGGEGGDTQRHDIAIANKNIPSLQHQPESIDLISSDENDEKVAVNEFPKDKQTVADQVQSTMQQRTREKVDVNTSGHLKKKKSKWAGGVDTKNRHKCDLCEYWTEYRIKLTEHLRAHTNERPYRCEVCDKRFTLKENLIRHIKIHRDMFAFQCSNCRQGFSDENKWKSHESCCKARGFECHLCKKIFLGRQHLVDHVRKHTGEKSRCPKCEKQFSSDRGLAIHMKSHGKLFRFQCLNCHQGFLHKTPWKLHERRCKSKQFECYLCSKKFRRQKGSLLRHMRYKHTGEKPFGCSDCPKRFCEKSNLASHTKRCHFKDK